MFIFGYIGLAVIVIPFILMFIDEMTAYIKGRY
jgi:hypothetical protein